MQLEHDLNEFNEVVEVLKESNVKVRTRVFDELVPDSLKCKGYRGVCIGLYRDEPVYVVFYHYGNRYALIMDAKYQKELSRTCNTCGKFKKVSDNTFNIKDGATIPSCRECRREYPSKSLNTSIEELTNEDTVSVPREEYEALKAIQESREELLNRLVELELFVMNVISLTDIIQE